ncbi:unnamed protein product [Prorocentrum cordatum]|uniref:Uncharacterized protein n=1 Tax=Prorocentrum cordatum TaxID=2364126 RepID=A0ABN9YBH9_9DINO|nr:unnamed protein product [Polarella glacialis]
MCLPPLRLFRSDLPERVPWGQLVAGTGSIFTTFQPRNPQARQHSSIVPIQFAISLAPFLATSFSHECNVRTDLPISQEAVLVQPHPHTVIRHLDLASEHEAPPCSGDLLQKKTEKEMDKKKASKEE